jgi:hypothetical protein
MELASMSTEEAVLADQINKGFLQESSCSSLARAKHFLDQLIYDLLKMVLTNFPEVIPTPKI